MCFGTCNDDKISGFFTKNQSKTHNWVGSYLTLSVSYLSLVAYCEFNLITENSNSVNSCASPLELISQPLASSQDMEGISVL